MSLKVLLVPPDQTQPSKQAFSIFLRRLAFEMSATDSKANAPPKSAFQKSSEYAAVN